MSIPGFFTALIYLGIISSVIPKGGGQHCQQQHSIPRDGKGGLHSGGKDGKQHPAKGCYDSGDLPAVENKVLAGCLCAFGCEVIFGFSAVFTKQVTGLVTPLTLLGWRFPAAKTVNSTPPKAVMIPVTCQRLGFFFRIRAESSGRRWGSRKPPPRSAAPFSPVSPSPPWQPPP